METVIDTIELVERFSLVIDLGIILVPESNPAIRLNRFAARNGKEFYPYDENLVDENFHNPTHPLMPGDKIRVSAFRRVARGTVTSEECLAFLTARRAALVGAQGLAIVLEQILERKVKRLTRGLRYESFDQKERLWKNANGSHGVPGTFAQEDNDFSFDLMPFERARDNSHALLCFWKVISVRP